MKYFTKEMYDKMQYKDDDHAEMERLDLEWEQKVNQYEIQLESIVEFLEKGNVGKITDHYYLHDSKLISIEENVVVYELCWGKPQRIAITYHDAEFVKLPNFTDKTIYFLYDEYSYVDGKLVHSINFDHAEQELVIKFSSLEVKEI